MQRIRLAVLVTLASAALAQAAPNYDNLPPKYIKENVKKLTNLCTMMKLETMPQVGTPEMVQDVCFQAVLDGTWTIADWEEYQLEKQARKERELNDSKKQQ